MTQSTKIFAQLLKGSLPIQGKSMRLTNVTFFLGAGFSKSWDSSFPTGNELFSFPYSEWSTFDGPLDEFLTLCNYQTFELDIDALMFKDIVYQIGMMKKYPELRPRYIDDQNLNMVEKHLRYLVRQKFECLAPLYFEEDEKLRLSSPLTKEQKKILSFFRTLERSGDGSQGIPEGLRAHYITTNYDFVIEAILDNVLAPDDSYQLYNYRGLTAMRYCGRKQEMTFFDNSLVGNLLKINGGFEVFKSENGFEFDYRELKDDAALRANPPQLMLPSREQDYTQEYFRALFPKVIRLLQETTVLIVVGYSLPDEDALLRLIVRQFAEDRVDGNKKILFYIDLSSAETQLQKVNGVFPHVGELKGLKVLPYVGSFSSWCHEVVKELKQLSKATSPAATAHKLRKMKRKK
ncbi:hypothetical protein OYC61_011555 [Alcaligenes nematophilus]|uniref:SIR2-like domain-containing protein n=1 Tax=Alcaligenes nematophilus TaxID=2994643 RepID=A0ABU3MT25_9BURK|nr:hypothetical protein [Alcaligenes nematophilus]MDT8470531.1 hypothetical protein [Alcaligenes nematophilus]MDT8504931.1 hypothetical protein [Alcaligenes nematophilus]MDT8527087.1 hypothetical protein [Alcaligenes nematophilus]